MPIPGPQAHQQLMAAYDQTAAQLEGLRGQLGQVAQQRDRLEDDRDQTLTKLAEYYLPDLTTDSIQKTWASIRPTISEILLRKEGRLRELKTQLEDENFFRTNLEANLKDINQRLDAAENRQMEIASEVEAFLSVQTDFVELSNRAAMAEIALQRAQDNLDEVSQDAARKLPAFNECKLFSYLKDRHFGTPEYASRGLTRRMDRGIAKMVNYSESKRNFDYLTNTPNTMRTIIAEDRGALDTVLHELQQHRDRAAEKFGLMTQVHVVETIVGERESALTSLTTQAAACEATQSHLNELENPRCEFYREAVDLFRGMLADTQSSELRQEARRTPEVTDDQIVASLRGIETQLDQTDVTTSRHHEELQQSQLVYEAVGRLIQRFRASGYDRARCQLSDALDLSGSLDRIRSPTDVDTLWDSLRRTQNWGPSTMDKITAAAANPMTQVMVNAMAHAAGGAMSEHARRAGQRTDRRRGW